MLISNIFSTCCSIHATVLSANFVDACPTRDISHIFYPSRSRRILNFFTNKFMSAKWCEKIFENYDLFTQTAACLRKEMCEELFCIYLCNVYYIWKYTAIQSVVVVTLLCVLYFFTCKHIGVMEKRVSKLIFRVEWNVWCVQCVVYGDLLWQTANRVDFDLFLCEEIQSIQFVECCRH